MVAPLASPNTNSSVSISTAVGFRTLRVKDYIESVEALCPDIVVGLGDIPHGRAFGTKRLGKATDRTIEWMQQHIALRHERNFCSHFMAPLLPVDCAKQRFYLDVLGGELRQSIDGLAIYDCESLDSLPEGLCQLSRLALTDPGSPRRLLQEIASGIDIFIVPFISTATDAGIALDFSFPVKVRDPQEPLQLGINMWIPIHATDLSALSDGCQCYACTNHHRAYVQHLLVAKEMLGWVLLQIHNHHVMDAFFAGVRGSIRDNIFDADVSMFQKVYVDELPQKTGQGPRVRGYQIKSSGGDAKKNQPPFTMLGSDNDKAL